ncbi:MAG: helix-turn-helix domain-containing protein [Gammaproteobacteria bacterium]
MSEASTPQTDPQQAQTPPEPVQLPGRRLREAREGQGLTQEEAAERLHLHHSQVAALENDDYAHFSAPIFIRGYLNNYARLLGLDPEEVVRALEQQGLEQPPILSELTAAMPSVRRHGMPMHIRALVLAGGTIVFLAALWFLLQPERIGGVGDEPVRQEPVAAVTAAPPAAEVTAATPESAAAPAQPPVSAVQEFPDDEIREEPPPNPDEPMDELVLRFSGESWVEVADVTGRRMAYRMGNFPDVLRLRGLAPFDILLGNARNVTIEYNGEPYENVPISRTNVASFRLGVAQ